MFYLSGAQVLIRIWLAGIARTPVFTPPRLPTFFTFVFLVQQMPKSIANQPPKNPALMERKERLEYEQFVKNVAKNGPRLANVQISELDKTVKDLRRKRAKAMAKQEALMAEHEALLKRREDVEARKKLAMDSKNENTARMESLTVALGYAQSQMSMISTSTRDKLSLVNSQTSKWNGQRAVKELAAVRGYTTTPLYRVSPSKSKHR